ncbi:MAG TPA: hypothetical protein PL045_03705 [Chitinophagaceae bacterium]|nr:hypothetical protein [Chitinophagaceae bacterium]
MEAKKIKAWVIYMQITGRKKYIRNTIHRSNDSKGIAEYCDTPADALPFASTAECAAFVINLHNPHMHDYYFEETEVMKKDMAPLSAAMFGEKFKDEAAQQLAAQKYLS